VPELTHDSSDDGFHEIQLSGKQLVFLFMSTTVVLVVTFLCGVLVGRNVRTDRGAEPPIETVAVAPADEEDGSSAPVSGEQPKPLSLDELKAQGRLTAENPSDEPRPKAQPEPAAAPPAPQPEAKAPPVEQKPERPDAGVPTSGRSGTWFLQVAALSTRDAAAVTIRQLVAKGYPAYLDDSAPKLFRVRVGRYGTREEAVRVAQKLQREEQYKSDIRR